ncbi:MAG: ATP-binding cassette domain-containing protein [Candidatus Eisenbacteria bacterium]|nr:ATP-binding cassette domain-containing protein [Candidatus Eisenbacteria bacterium]
MSSDSILELQEIILELGGRRILDCLSMAFWPGHVHAVVGPNGAGKSTLASMIMGLGDYRAHGGDVRFEDRSIKELSIDQRARLGIALAWQEPARYEGLTVRRFVGAGAADATEAALRRRLEQVALDPDRYLDRAVDRTLSGGERKRIELASILAQEPRLVMMDEPDSGIDVEALGRIFDAIRLLREEGVTVLLITHSQTVLEQADHAFLICCGRMVAKGSVAKIKEFYGERCLPCDHQNAPREDCNGER